MLESALQLLKMTGEGAVLMQRGRAVYANADARAALGEDCLGKKAEELFGDTVSGVQSPAFLAQIRLRGRPFLLRMTHAGSEQVFFLRPQETLPALLNQPFLYALRSDLMNMGMAAEHLRLEAEDLGNEKLLDSLSSVTRGQFQILRLLNNASLILSLAEGSAVCSLKRFSLSALCASVVDGVSALTPGIRFFCSCGADVTVQADPQLIKDLLINLLSNAVRHGQGCSRISVSLLESARSVVLAVDDDGCGIPPEELPLVFDRYRHSFALRQMVAGPGLGLTAARLIAQLHGGTLLLESREGRGTTLRVSLQRETEPELNAPWADEEPPCTQKELLTGLADCLPADCFRGQLLD